MDWIIGGVSAFLVLFPWCVATVWMIDGAIRTIRTRKVPAPP